MKKILYLYLFNLVLPFTVFGQELVLDKVLKFENPNAIEIDHFGNVYIKEDYSIYKYNDQLEFEYKFSDNLYNENIYFDISDPLKPLVLNKDFYSIKIFDHKFGIINEIFLNEVYQGLIDVIVSASAQEYWIFDKQDNKLKKLNYDFMVLEESTAFHVLFDRFSNVKKMRIENDHIYILDDFGIKTFDFYGNFINQFELNHVNDFQIVNQNFVYLKGKNLTLYDPKLFIENVLLEIPSENDILSIKITKNRLYKLSEHALKIYQFSF